MTTLHRFRANNITIKTERQPTGEYTAIDRDNYDGPGSAMGWGSTELEAIADLAEQLRERGELED
jgi:hypothetical protein